MNHTPWQAAAISACLFFLHRALVRKRRLYRFPDVDALYEAINNTANAGAGSS